MWAVPVRNGGFGVRNHTHRGVEVLEPGARPGKRTHTIDRLWHPRRQICRQRDVGRSRRRRCRSIRSRPAFRPRLAPAPLDCPGRFRTIRAIDGAAAGPSQAGRERRGGKPAAAAMVTDRKQTGDRSFDARRPPGLERQSTLSWAIRGNHKGRFRSNRLRDQRRHYAGIRR